jgi:hypothetical protein
MPPVGSSVFPSNIIITIINGGGGGGGRSRRRHLSRFCSLRIKIQEDN